MQLSHAKTGVCLDMRHETAKICSMSLWKEIFAGVTSVSKGR